MPLKPIARKQLPLEDEISLHQKGWVIQRIGWVLMFIFLVLSLLGFFGNGPVSKKEVQVGNIQLNYERFGRYEHGMEMKFQSNGENIGTISIPIDYLENFRMNEFIPKESRQITSAGYVNFVFDGKDNALVKMQLIPVRSKTVEGVFKVNANSFSIKQTIYP